MNISSTPFLSIQPTGQNFFTVVVVAQVTFAQNENPLQARLDCKILGNDPLRDDFIFSYATHFFLEFSAGQSARFERTNVPRSQLNEDIIGADEIVGELTLRIGSNSVVKRTNIVQLV